MIFFVAQGTRKGSKNAGGGKSSTVKIAKAMMKLEPDRGWRVKDKQSLVRRQAADKKGKMYRSLDKWVLYWDPLSVSVSKLMRRDSERAKKLCPKLARLITLFWWKIGYRFLSAVKWKLLNRPRTINKSILFNQVCKSKQKFMSFAN